MKKLLFFFCFLAWSQCFGAEIYYISHGNCEGSLGLLISVQDEQSILLNSKGEISKVNQNDIKNILIYGVDNESFKVGNPSEESLKHIKRISIFAKDRIESFYAWPYKFVEDLTFFYDIDGRTRVISEDQIYRIENIQSDFKNKAKKSFSPELTLSEYFPNCTQPNKKEKKSGLRPIRILSDKVKIAELLLDYKKGEQYLSNLQDRTLLYPRPYLFEKRARFGLVFAGDDVDSSALLPFYFKWSNGKNYHFQSENLLGSYYSILGPQIQSTSLIASHFKSHFLNGSFEGNIFGAAAGKEIWDGSIASDHAVTIFPNYNYALLMGFDFKKLRLQYGMIYFNLAYEDTKQAQFREVLANEASPIFKIQYTEKKWLSYLAFSETNYKNESSDINTFVRQGYSTNYLINNIEYKSNYYRAALEYDVNESLNLKLNFVHLNGKYFEKTTSSGNNTIDFTQNSLGIIASHRFSYYIAVKAKGYSIKRKIKTNFSQEELTTDDTINTWGGYFELLF